MLALLCNRFFLAESFLLLSGNIGFEVSLYVPFI